MHWHLVCLFGAFPSRRDDFELGILVLERPVHSTSVAVALIQVRDDVCFCVTLGAALSP